MGRASNPRETLETRCEQLVDQGGEVSGLEKLRSGKPTNVPFSVPIPSAGPATVAEDRTLGNDRGFLVLHCSDDKGITSLR